ncbi:MAG: heme-binding protein [Alphaproteobacteria bacterium]|nr:heme-binding protein [Alphaproteobacteria bacterium]MBV8335759.1 heme-binding protein [Alphaproteobacteria bacterium]
MSKSVKLAVVWVIMAFPAMPAPALEMRPVLTLDVARKIVEACIAKAQQQGWKMHVAVLDIGGNLKAFARMDDAQLLSEEVAMRKAYTAAALPRSTREVAELAYSNPDRRPGGIAFLPHVAVIQGGLPIMTADGVHIGGVGVSGSTAQNDEACAQAGLDSVKDELK